MNWQGCLRNNLLRLLAAMVAVTLVTLLAGCGSSMNNMTSSATASAMQFRMGDAPSARVVSFEATVGPVTLTSSSGMTVSALSGTRRIELTHLAGTSEPLALLNVAQGSFTSAAITVSNPEVVFLSSAGQFVKLEPALNQTVTVDFSPALTIGVNSSVLTLDLSLANSLTFDAQGNVTAVNFTSSSFTATASAVVAENQQEAENGELEDITGLVTAVSGSSFTLNVGQSGASLIFTTDSTTEFKDGAALASLVGTIVTVEGITKPDGTLFAKEVEGAENENGAEVEGLVTHVTGTPATQLTVLVQDGSGNGMNDAMVGSTVTVDVSNAQFGVHQGDIDMSGMGGLPSTPSFPFDASTVHAGQRVEIETASAMSGNPLAAEKVNLEQQALTGVVSALNAAVPPTSFTLTLPADSAFAMLAGTNSITVFWQPGTDVHDLPDGISNGATIRVRGLVFFTGGGWDMIARRITL